MQIVRNTTLFVQVVNLLVVVAVGIGLLTLALSNNRLLNRNAEEGTRAACNSQGFKEFPDALSNPAALAKLIQYNEECALLNGVTPRPSVKFPVVVR